MLTKLSIAILALSAALALLAAGGCGGGDSNDASSAAESTVAGDGATEGSEEGNGSSTRSGTAGADEGLETDSRNRNGGADQTLPKAQFIKQADLICRTRRKQIIDGYQPYLDGGAEEVREASDTIINQIMAPAVEAEIGEIRELPPPASGAQQVEAVLSALETAIAQARANPDEFVLKAGVFDESERLGKIYGFKVCGSA